MGGAGAWAAAEWEGEASNVVIFSHLLQITTVTELLLQNPESLQRQRRFVGLERRATRKTFRKTVGCGRFTRKIWFMWLYRAVFILMVIHPQWFPSAPLETGKNN